MPDVRATLLVTLVAMVMQHAGAANATGYRLDPKETRSSFELWVFGLIPIRGHFTRTTGNMNFDSASNTGSIDVSIDTTSVVASSARAEAAARSSDFFDVEKYPQIDFKSSRFIFEGRRLHAVEGELTLRATKQPVTLIVSHANCNAATTVDPASCRAEATFSVRRSEFGMKAWSHSIGDEVTIRIAIVASAEADETKVKPALPNGTTDAATPPKRTP